MPDTVLGEDRTVGDRYVIYYIGTCIHISHMHPILCICVLPSFAIILQEKRYFVVLFFEMRKLRPREAKITFLQSSGGWIGTQAV